MAKDFDAIIIGAGIIGAATALAMARKGWKTLSLDKLPAAGYGSTSGSCAIIRPYYSTVDGSAIAYESHFYWKDWEKFLGAPDERGLARYVDCGCIVMKTEGNKALKPTMALMDTIGCPYEELTPEQLKQRLPIVNTESFGPAKRPEDSGFGEPNGKSMEGAVLFPAGGYVTDPQLATHNLQRAAEAQGAVFRFKVSVTEILQEGGRAAGVKLDNGETLRAPVVINIAGPHSFKINRLAGVEEGMKIKTRALRHEVAHVPSPQGYNFERDGTVFSDSDIATYFRPEMGNHLLIGSEDPPCDTQEWVDPDDFNREFTEQWKVQVMRVGQRIPDLGIPSKTKGVVELYDVTDDWIPIYDKSDLPGFYMGVGSSGNQFKNAPIAGEMMADLVEACEGGRDHDRDPVSFTLKYTGREVSLGFYSRLREINKDSSFSVLG